MDVRVEPLNIAESRSQGWIDEKRGLYIAIVHAKSVLAIKKDFGVEGYESGTFHEQLSTKFAIFKMTNSLIFAIILGFSVNI